MCKKSWFNINHFLQHGSQSQHLTLTWTFSFKLDIIEIRFDFTHVFSNQMNYCWMSEHYVAVLPVTI